MVWYPTSPHTHPTEDARRTEGCGGIVGRCAESRGNMYRDIQKHCTDITVARENRISLLRGPEGGAARDAVQWCSFSGKLYSKFSHAARGAGEARRMQGLDVLKRDNRRLNVDQRDEDRVEGLGDGEESDGKSWYGLQREASTNVYGTSVDGGSVAGAGGCRQRTVGAAQAGRTGFRHSRDTAQVLESAPGRRWGVARDVLVPGFHLQRDSGDAPMQVRRKDGGKFQCKKLECAQEGMLRRSNADVLSSVCTSADGVRTGTVPQTLEKRSQRDD
ncbi:hypothetical protein B0H16DRAFT_1765024 [Mycena metata]|uniref:Uncharacterized protein n=1 Tax=Mycena metata TaxID=1033252 RepID=A0AAD7I5D2_9AGAR|nr:hypothetical protein B0H16DRAFT_1765024 [Mycena metata]